MSTSSGSGGGGGSGVQPIPAGSRKMVQSLKEIVSCSEAEIYATLKDCNMDPNEAVNRLLSQDTFHEVKRKKEKKKEGKDTAESRVRGASNISNRTSKSGGIDRYSGRGGSTPYYSAESAPSHAKPAYRRENGSTAYTSSLSSAAAMSGTKRGGGPPVLSEDNKGSVLGSRDVTPPGPQPPSATHSAWVGSPGQITMADVVKMGRPHNKVANTTNTSHNKFHEPSTMSQQVPIIDEWPSIEKPAASKDAFAPEHTVSSEVNHEAPAVAFESVNQDYEGEEGEETEDDETEYDDDDVENPGANDVAVIVDSREESSYENDLYENTGSYQPQAHDFEEVGASVASVTRNLQQLNVEKDDKDESPSHEIVPSVVIPDHLQVQNADCSHLTFGSFGSVPIKTNLEEADISSVGHQDSRNSEYYVEDSLRNVSDGTLFHGTGSSPALQQEELKPENADVSHGDQYSFPSSNPGYSFDNNAQNLNAAFSHTNSERQNLAQFSTQSYPNSRPSTLLAANMYANRESEIQYSQFPASQQIAANYGNPVSSSSIGGSTISMSEALKTAGLQPAPQALSGANVASGPPLPQHLPVHPYSQPALPLGPFANMIGYPFLPQSYTYMPSAFQQANYHQSLAAVLPQYKSSASVSSLPQSAASIASGYGAFGNNAAAVHSNFSMNPNSVAAPSASALSYDDVLSSQYKDQLLSLQQQNENSAMWMHGHNSRTMPSIPASTYYNNYHQAQAHQQPPSGGFRQVQQQQPSQNYGDLVGYPNNYYHSQAGMSPEQQQPQNPRDGPFGGPQGQQQQQPKQSQLWQNTY